MTHTIEKAGNAGLAMSFSLNQNLWLKAHLWIIWGVKSKKQYPHWQDRNSKAPFSASIIPLWNDVISYHTQQPPVLLEGGTAAEHACYHDNDSSQDQNVGRGSVGHRGKKADVVSLLNQSPDPHRHHNTPCQLREEERVQSLPMAVI